jgi:two-component system phosphate regulon response regulator PhoB
MAQTKHVLVVEDERDLAELLAFNLRKAGYVTSVAHSGPQALELIGAQLPDLVLLDVMLPGQSGTEVASRIRANPRTVGLPVIMLTARAEETDQIVGLAAGADDYITKPFSMKVVLARVEAVLRRSSGASASEPSLLRCGPVTLNLDTHEASTGDQAVKFTLTEFRLLAALMGAKGRVLSRNVLMSKAMGPGVTVTERTIDVHMTAVRRKLGAAGALVRTVRGVGYRVSEESDEPAIRGSDRA